MIPFSDSELRRPRGCIVCRNSKVRCGEQPGTTCARCIRLGRSCAWPALEPKLGVRRRGPRSRTGRQLLVPILPTGTAASIAKEPETENASLILLPDALSMMDDFFGYDASFLEDIDPHEYLALEFSGSLDFSGCAAFTGGVSSDNNLGYREMESYIYQSMTNNETQLPSSVFIGSQEHGALRHYQSTFSIYRTTKKPEWSTHTLLLDLGYHNEMIMRFILAVSINDQCHRKENSNSLEAQKHFDMGEIAFAKAIQRDSAQDHIPLMIAYLLFYLYLPNISSLPRDRIDQLSQNVLDYVKKHNLESKCLDRSRNHTPQGDDLSDGHRALLARLLIWIYDEDVKCSFQGFGGQFAEYLTIHRERTMALCEVSQNALAAHWGAKYPEAESIDDDDNAIELEFLWALTSLWQDINHLVARSEGEARSGPVHQVEQRFKYLEKKYSMVFQNAAETTIPRTRTLINADYDVVLFHALKVYFFRCTIPDLSMETPDDVNAALTNILTIFRRTFASNRNELHDRLQWPLFLAGIEIEDKSYRDWIWIIARLSKKPRTVLERITGIQDVSGTRIRLPMKDIRRILYGENEAVSTSLTSNDPLLDGLSMY